MITFLFLMLLVPLSLFSSGSTVYFAFSIIGLFIYFSNKIKTNFNSIINNIVYLSILIFVFLLSSFNGGFPLFSAIKAVQLFILVKLAMYSGENYISFSKFKMIYISFILLSILSLPYNYFSAPLYEPLRVSGFLSDPNYFGAVCFLLFATAQYIQSEYRINLYLIKILLLAGIIFSFSATVIIIFIIYLILTRFSAKSLHFLGFPAIFIMLAFIPFYSVFFSYVLTYASSYIVTDIQLLYFKIESINQRFEVQVLGLHLLQSKPMYLLFGLGSGRTLEFLPRALHNGYLQIIFAHGLVTYILFCAIILKLYLLIKAKYRLNKYVLVGFLALLLINGFIDVFFSALITIFFLLLNYATRLSLQKYSNIFLADR